MYCLIMAIRLDTLPTDPTVLTEMVLALDAENEQLRAVVQTLKDMIFGARSERLVAVADEQLALELNDLETGVTPPPAANDDKPTRLSAKTRKKATRNIARCPSTCRVASKWSSRRQRCVPAVRASSTRSAKMSTKCSM